MNTYLSEPKQAIQVAFLWNTMFKGYFFPRFHIGMEPSEKNLFQDFTLECFEASSKKNAYPMQFREIPFKETIKKDNYSFLIKKTIEMSILKKDRQYYLEITLLSEEINPTWEEISKRIYFSEDLSASEKKSFESFLMAQEAIPRWLTNDLTQLFVLDELEEEGNSSADTYEPPVRIIY